KKGMICGMGRGSGAVDAGGSGKKRGARRRAPLSCAVGYRASTKRKKKTPLSTSQPGCAQLSEPMLTQLGANLQVFCADPRNRWNLKAIF
ncbi:MAG: hypothetical protein PUI29_10110, partial [Aeromonadales bacterium]|nr:hypothetical protein [Aeromonadales bacterium]